MFGQSRIALKLLFAYGAMALLLVLAAVIGLGGFQRVADTQDSVVERAVPALRDAHAVTELNSRISTMAQGMAEIGTEPERRAVNTELDRLIASFAPLVASLQAQGIESRFLSPIEDSVRRLKEILGERNVQLGNRIRLQQRLDALSKSLSRDLLVLNQLADSLVANATARTTAVTSSLYDLVESEADESALYGVFDRLVEVDIDAMERTHELRQRSADLFQVVNQVTEEDDQGDVELLRNRAADLLSILNRRIGEITDPQRKQRARELLNTMNMEEGPGGVSSIFGVRSSLLALQQRLQQSEREYNLEALQLDNVVSELSANSGAVTTRATELAQRSLEENRRRFLWAAVIVVALMALILWRYVHSGVVRRLLGLKDATLAIAGGQLDHPVDESGKDEISEMARVLRLFRDNAVAKEQLDQELQQYKDNLERTVRERTLQLEQTNSRLAEEVAQHEIARERAEQANQAKTDFLATISHELRTPLSGALGTLGLLEQTALSNEQRRYLSTIDTANTLLLDILDNVLGYSQVRAGKIELQSKPFNLADLVERIVGTMRTGAEEKHVSISYTLEPGLPVELIGDSGKLNQVLMNLVGNAVKFTREGSVSVEVKQSAEPGLAPSSGANPRNIKLDFEVVDTGIGIQRSRQREMFKAFTQADTSISRTFGGVGLGLAICQRLVRLMGGAISMTSEPGQGTSIRFTLPLERNIVDPAPVDSGRRDVTEALDILLVEDDPTMMEVTSRYLLDLGLRPDRAVDGETALARLRATVPDLVLLDISLPGIDGLEVLSQIRQSEQATLCDVPVLAMSAHVFEEEVASYLAAGMDGFIGKPFTPDQLSNAISRAFLGEHPIEGVRTDLVAGDISAERLPVLESGTIAADVEILGRDRVSDLVDLFEVNGIRYLEQLTDLGKAGNQSEISKVAHRMKSAAGNFGFVRLSSRLERLERGEVALLTESDSLFHQSVDEAKDRLASATGSQNM